MCFQWIKSAIFPSDLYNVPSITTKVPREKKKHPNSILICNAISFLRNTIVLKFAQTLKIINTKNHFNQLIQPKFFFLNYPISSQKFTEHSDRLLHTTSENKNYINTSRDVTSYQKKIFLFTLSFLFFMINFILFYFLNVVLSDRIAKRGGRPSKHLP